MGAGISKRGSYDFTANKSKNCRAHSNEGESLCITLTPQQIYEDLIKVSSPTLSIKGVGLVYQENTKKLSTFERLTNDQVSKDLQESEDDCKSFDEDFKSLEEFSPIMFRRENCNSGTFFDTIDGAETFTMQSNNLQESDWQNAFNQDFWTKTPKETYIENYCANVDNATYTSDSSDSDTATKLFNESSESWNKASKGNHAYENEEKLDDTGSCCKPSDNDAPTKLCNEYSNVITAESIEKLRNMLIKKEACVVTKRPLLNIAEQEEEEYEIFPSEENSNKIEVKQRNSMSNTATRKDSIVSCTSEVYYELDEQSENEAQEYFYDAIEEEYKLEQLLGKANVLENHDTKKPADVDLTDSNVTVRYTEVDTTNSNKELYDTTVKKESDDSGEHQSPTKDDNSEPDHEIQTPDIIRFACTVEDYSCNNCNERPKYNADCHQSIKRWNSLDLLNTSGIFPVQKSTLDMEWLSKTRSTESLISNRPSPIQLTKSTPILWDCAAEDPTPEELAEDQMRLWAKQKNTHQEAAKDELLLIMLAIKDIKYQLENSDATNDNAYDSDMYQNLIKIMRDVNNIQTTNFLEEVLELKNSALIDVYDCLKLLQGN